MAPGHRIAQSIGPPSLRLVEKEAVGVVACITPWNVPLQINLAKCVPALAAGCTVVLKPAPDTPWSATLLGRIVHDHTDIPPGVFNVVAASEPQELGQQLVADPRVDMVSFTRLHPHRQGHHGRGRWNGEEGFS